MSQEYVVGFAFSEGLSKVALIRKNRPQWQSGKLNGVGGHIEPGETPEQAMEREFGEETGSWWPGDAVKFAKISEDGQFTVYFFAARVLDIYSLQTVTDEEVEVIDLDDMLPYSVVDNIPWLIPLAIDVLRDGRPNWVEANYPKRVCK